MNQDVLESDDVICIGYKITVAPALRGRDF